MACPPDRRPRRLMYVLLVVAALALTEVLVGGAAAAGPSDWTTYGHDPANTRNQPFEHEISPANVGSWP